MSKVDKELDEYGKNKLAVLRQSPPIDPKIMAEEKARFLLKGENLRLGLVPNLLAAKSSHDERKSKSLPGRFAISYFKALTITLLVFLLVVGSGFTVYAAQGSLPGDPLYSIKSIGEDVRLSMTFSTKTKLELTLDYTNRRLVEISQLASKGKSLPDQTSMRYQHELDHVLQLAAQLDDQQMQYALGQIKILAEDQGMTVDELITTLPDQASPAIIQLKERLQEQVQLSTIGEKNPQAFRLEIREWAHKRQGPKKEPTADDLDTSPALGTAIPNLGGEDMTPQPDNNGRGNSGNSQWQSTPGNGNHGPNPTKTP